MKCVTFFLEISCLVSQRDMPRVVDIISFLSDAKLPRNATCPEFTTCQMDRLSIAEHG